MAYEWSTEDVFFLLGLKYNPYKTENFIKCPKCDSSRLSFNVIKGTGHCFACHEGYDSASLYAAYKDMPVKEARFQIKKELGIDRNDYKPVVSSRPPVINEETPLAAPEVRDKTLRAFLQLLPLLEEHKTELLARGFTEAEISANGYASMPDELTPEENEKICAKLIADGFTLDGVPPFYVDKKSGKYRFVKSTCGILLPQVDTHNLWVGICNRKEDGKRRVINDEGELEAKCCWLSSKNFNRGTGAKTSVHCAIDFIYDNTEKRYIPALPPNGKVILTEGSMKGDLASQLLSEVKEAVVPVISVPGVNALNALPATLNELIKYGLKEVMIAYDMDYLTNPNVKEALNKLTSILKETGVKITTCMKWDTNIPDHPDKKLKGIDDYLAFKLKGIIPR